MRYGNDIKTARKILGLNQIDLSNDNISRNLISDIENDKINLVPSKALIIFKILIEEATKQGKDINLNFDELLSENDNYITLCDIFNLYRKLIRSSQNTFSASTLEEYRISIQRHDVGLIKYFVFMKLYEIIPEKEIEFRTKVLIETLSFLKWELFDKIYLYFKNALENVTPIANRLGKHSELIHYYKYYEENMVRYGYSIEPKFYYNLALFYKKIEEYNESYNYIERTLFFDRELSIEQRADLLILKGNICVENREFEEAIVAYKEILKMLEFNDKIQKSYALSNLVYCMTLNKNEHILVKEYYFDLRDLIPYIESERKNLNVLYRNLAIAADYLEDTENLILYIKCSFEECTTISDTVDLLYKYYKYIPNVITIIPFYKHLMKIQVSTVSEKDKIKLMSIVLSIIGNNSINKNDERAKDFNKYIINNYGGSI